jgi:hypothetical protein
LAFREKPLVKSEEVYAKALRMMELAKGTMNASQRRMIMDGGHELIKKAKRLRQEEPAKASPQTRYTVRFHGEQGLPPGGPDRTAGGCLSFPVNSCPQSAGGRDQEGFTS